MRAVTLFQGLAFVCVLAAVLVPQAFAETSAERVRVEYVQPEKFADVVDRYGGSEKLRNARLEELRRHITSHAEKFLSAGQTLEVVITDVDMAGEVEPWHRNANDLRIVRDVYPPRIDLNFRLIGPDGKLLKEGERKLRDMNFMITGIRYRDDSLRYEKALLDDWLEKEFPAAG